MFRSDPCNNTADDITRYICFITNPVIPENCSPKNQGACPPYHVLTDGSLVYRNNTSLFPYQCYHLYCAPPGSNEPGSGSCDPYSNPVPQELVQILPCSEWEGTGFPTVLGEGWVGDDRLWNLNISALTSKLYLFGALGPTDNREWISFEIGPERMLMS
jgi:hypothetical protein